MDDVLQIFTHLRKQDVIDDECETWWKANYAAPKKKMKRGSKSKSKRATSAIPEMPPLFSAGNDQDNLDQVMPPLPGAGYGGDKRDGEGKV